MVGRTPDAEYGLLAGINRCANDDIADADVINFAESTSENRTVEMIYAPKDSRFYRSRFNDCGMWPLATFVGALYPLTQVVKEIQRETYVHGGRPVLIAMWALVIAVCLPAAVRSPMWGVIVAPTAVKVRNLLKTHTVRWDEVERLEIGRYNPWPSVGIVVLKDGRRIPITAVQPAYPWSPASKFAKTAVPALNQQLDIRRSSGIGSSASGT